MQEPKGRYRLQSHLKSDAKLLAAREARCYVQILTLEPANIHTCNLSEMPSSDQPQAAASSTSQTEVQTAGLPGMHGGLKVLCVNGVSASLTSIHTWTAEDRQAYELCLHWSQQAVAAWLDRQAQAGSGQHPLRNYPVLEPHAAICKHPAART